jgi:hypothetical protein
MKTYFKILLVVLSSSQILSCKDDESPSPQFQILNGSSSYEDLNECALSSGNPGTHFDFELDLQPADASASIKEVRFDLLWDDGDNEKNIEEDDFTIVDNTLTFDWCFRFGSSEWFEVTVRVIDENNVKSNSQKIKVNKPDGAN